MIRMMMMMMMMMISSQTHLAVAIALDEPATLFNTHVQNIAFVAILMITVMRNGGILERFHCDGNTFG